MSTSWTLAIDFGTSFSAAAISDGGTVELVEVEDGRRFPSGVLLGEDGTLLVGRVASNQARRAPERFERTPKRLVGQPAVLLGGQAVEVADLVAAVLRRVGEAAIQRQGGSRPAALVLTCPAEWGPERRAQLVEAARRAGLGEVSLLTEPEAAAWFFVADRRGEEPVVGEGRCVAVYDLGGGTFDTAVLRRRAGDFELAGPPGGLDWFGGEAFDERIFELVLKRVYERDPEVWRQLTQPTSPAWERARMQLREDVRDAKEALSTMARVVVPVSGGEEVLDVELTQGEFEDLIRADLERTVSVLEKTVRDAGVAREEIAALYLTGGSSRIPLAAALASEFHASAYTRPDPKTLVAHGATAAPVEAVAPVETDLTERVGTETQRAEDVLAEWAEAQRAEATEPQPTDPEPAESGHTGAAPPRPQRSSKEAFLARARSSPRIVVLAALACVTLTLVAAVLVLAGGDDGNDAEPAATAPAESEIRQVVEEFSTSSDPAVCDLGTQAYLKKAWGGSGTTAIEACRTQLPKLKRSGQVSIQSLELSGSSASAKVTFGDDEEGEYTLIDTQKGWRINGYVLTKEGSNTGR